MENSKTSNYRIQESFIPDDMDISMQQRFEHTADAHKHVHYEIVYVSAGELSQILNGEKLVMGLGECIILSLDDVHSYAEFPNQNTIIRDIFISPKLFESLLLLVTHSQEASNNFLQNRLHPVRFSPSELNELEHLAQKISASTDIYTKRAKSIDLTLRILCKFFEHQEPPQLPSSTSLVNLIFDSLNKDHTIKGGIPRLATWLKYNRTYICRVFKKETGMSLSEYITNVRLERVAYYLKTTNYPLRTIADIVGMESLSYLNKVFKAKYGLTPAKYRKSNIEN